jgi:hypothetical protein
VNQEWGAARRRAAAGQTQEFRLCPVSTQSGVLTGEAKAALAEELTAFRCVILVCPKRGTRHLSGIRARQRRSSRKGCGRGSAHVADPHGPLGRVQGGFIKRLWELLQGATRAPGRSGRHRNSRSAAQSGHGDGANHARGRDLLGHPGSRPRRLAHDPFGPPASVPASAGASPPPGQPAARDCPSWSGQSSSPASPERQRAAKRIPAS